MSSTRLPSTNKNRDAMKKMLGITGMGDKVHKEKPNLLFRGFIGGDMFKTKKGYQGARVDQLWVRQVFESFKNDDTEIIDVAMKSSLADPDAKVIGGENGSVYSIGDYGFNTASQFRCQQKILAKNERRLARGRLPPRSPITTPPLSHDNIT
jgi:hypothetical protein